LSLTKRFAKAIQNYKPASIGLCGGVSANSELRNTIQKMGTEKGIQVCIPAFEYCTDNAAMVAMAGYEKFQQSQFTPLNATPFARAHK
jgi:N6-L-threonylcarbamoyladenine synthase